MIRTITRREAALHYARRGWAVFPLYEPAANGLCSCGNPKCPSPGKHPRVKHGVLEATTNEALIQEWWTKWREANIGIPTGKRSGVVVLDVDPRHGGDKSLAELEAMGGALKTLECETGGGGRHLYFLAPEERLKNKVGFMPGLDFRGDNGYVVAPPSTHITGGLYRWKKAV